MSKINKQKKTKRSKSRLCIWRYELLLSLLLLFLIFILIQLLFYINNKNDFKIDWQLNSLNEKKQEFLGFFNIERNNDEDYIITGKVEEEKKLVKEKQEPIEKELFEEESVEKKQESAEEELIEEELTEEEIIEEEPVEVYSIEDYYFEEDSVVENPVIEEPAIEEPIIEEPIIEDPVEEEPITEEPIEEEPVKVYYYNRNFGDSFSGDNYINLEESNMYLDETVTSLTFQPDYDMLKVKNCQDESCGLSSNTIITEDGEKICNSDNCLETRNTSLYYNNNLIQIPEEVQDYNIINLNIGLLDSKWLVGFVVGEGFDEYGLVYYFDGNDFTKLIGVDTEYKIKPKYNRLGGKIAFAGSDNNFMILYGGYDAKAFQVVDNEIIDISHMFGLRVASFGFWPKILKSGNGNNSTWYVCSLDDNKLKFIKLWQNNTSNIQGAIDLTYDVFPRYLYGHSANCYLAENDNEVFIVLKNDSSELWKFVDKGFNNNLDYSITSSNVFEDDDYVINASVEDLGLSVSEKGFASSVSDYGNLYLSNNNTDWQEVDIKEDLAFPSQGSNLYWRLNLDTREDKNYSPWFYHFNILKYAIE